MNSYFGTIANFCTRRAWLVIIVSVLIAAGAAGYIARHFAINTNVSDLLSANLPWRKRQSAYHTELPGQTASIIAVVSAPTPEFAGAAAAALTERLAPQTGLFRSVAAAGNNRFFERNSLLYLSSNDLAARMRTLSEAAPLIRTLSSDQSLRGLGHALSLSLQGLRVGRYKLDALARPLDQIADPIEAALAGKPATFSWRVLVNGASSGAANLSSLIEILPVLDYHALEPGRVSTAAIRSAAAAAGLQSNYDASVRLTGAVPLADQQFATLQQGVWLNSLLTAAIVLIVLWLALRSVRIVLAVVITLFIGLIVTAATGLLVVGAFNPISVAFAVLFVGLGADFAVQYSVRYRAQRYETHDLGQSLVQSARLVGTPLLLAAGAAAAGFLAFVPTDYRGIAQLGLIAGMGMAVAYIASMTLLPALLSMFAPRDEPKPLGYLALAPVDRFLQRHRILIVVATSVVVLLGLPFLFHLRFNFDPNSLQNSNAEAVATLRQLNSNPAIPFAGANVLTPAADANAVAKQLSGLPEVASTRNLGSFVPADQQAKLKVIADAAATLDPALQAKPVPAASDQENVATLQSTAKDLQDSADEASGPGADAAGRLAKDLSALAGADPQMRQKVQAIFIAPLRIDLQQISQSLHPQSVSQADLPSDLVQQWTAQNGLVRTEIVPKGNPNDAGMLRRFAQAVLSSQPSATGAAIEIYEWGNTVTTAFVKAGLVALCAIAILLWLVLRRIGDVLLTLIPLLVAAVATLEICGLTGFALNYANIIALPALLGIGVAFKIYYVMAWRAGQANFLQSSLTRAVFFSALMTATAFGSLWFAAYPGISSMGKLLALSLACTLVSAALFQPALMGPPRGAKIASPPQH